MIFLRFKKNGVVPLSLIIISKYQGRNRRKNLDATSAMVGRICPPVGDRVKVSENLGATSVAPVDTSLSIE